MSKTPLYTIGYGAREIEALIALLKERKIDYLIDVRSRPYSRYKPDFSKELLEKHLKAAGIRYVFMGDTLGGQPADPDCYTVDGKVDYQKMRQSAAYQEGIGRLQRLWDQNLPAVLMCSEGKPEMCHRSKLIGATLDEMAIEVVHIDEEGQSLSQEAVTLRAIGGQPSLFGPDFHRFTSRKRYRSEDDN